MDEQSTPDLTAGPHAAALRDAERQIVAARHYVQQVREDELGRVEQQLQMALQLLQSGRPDFSAAATACHRAYQHALRADVLAPVGDLL
jgi:hypothetical protein